jgi:hypothetical protein
MNQEANAGGDDTMPQPTQVPCGGESRGADEMKPSDWRNPEGMTPDDVVSSGGSGSVHTPPSGVSDDGRRDP